MKKQLALVLAAACLAAASIPATAMTLFGNPTVYVIDQSATSWADSAGMGFGNANDTFGDSAVLEKVVVTGKRVSNLEIVQVSSITFTGQNNAWDPAPLRQFQFDSRDQNVNVTPPSPQDKAKCITGCADIQNTAKNLCDTRSTAIFEASMATAGTIKIGRFIPKWGNKIPIGLEKTVADNGTKAAAAYNMICKTDAINNYNKCVSGTCGG